MKSPRPACRLVALLGIGACALAVPALAAPPAGALVDQGTRQAIAERLDPMPLLFVPEQVSPDGAMGYAVRGSEASVWLSASGLSYRLHPATGGATQADAGSWVVALDLVGATLGPPVGEDLLPTRVSYFKGTKDQWRTGLQSYSSVRYREPWPGVDLVVSGTAGQLESTFVVRPGADPGAIRLAYRGASAVRLSPDGGLVIETPLGDIREEAPFAYQDVDGHRVEVAAAFELDEGGEAGRQGYRFRLGVYDPERELVVDPVTLIYCGYIGGSGSEFLEVQTFRRVAIDAAGNAYVAGTTTSTEATFPVVAGPDPTYNGGESDAYVAKVRADGTALEYCGYIGGSGIDEGVSVAVDGSGNAYITGFTNSTESSFPVTVGPGLTYNGGDYDAFVVKVRTDGASLEYCGYIGGSDVDTGIGIGVDAAGNAYVSGTTASTEATFPVVVGPDLTYNGGNRDSFVAKVNAAGTGLDYCGYIGGASGEGTSDVAVDVSGSAYVTGSVWSDEASFPVTVGPDLTFNGANDVFVAKVRPDGSGFDYCGYIGGASGDGPFSIAVDVNGNAYVAGVTSSTEGTFPVSMGPDLTYNGGDTDAYVAKVNAAGTGLDYCGYIGGSDSDWGGGIAIDAAGNAYVAGTTLSTEATFPVTVGPDLTYNGDPGGRHLYYGDAFVARVEATGTGLDYCGYIGGASGDGAIGIAVDAAGNVYVAGMTSSTEATFPVTVGPDLTYNGGDTDAFVAKVSAFDGSFPGATWHFDEGSGTIAHDSLNGNDGTISGAVWTMGMSGTALAFWNGTTTSVSIPRSVFEGFGNTAYVEAWVYPTGLPSIAGTIFRKRAAYNDWSLYQLPDGRFRVDIFGYTGVGGVNGWNGLSIESPDALPLFTWSKLSSSYDGDTLTLSFDGVAVASATLSLPLMWFTPECPDDTYYEDGCYYGTWIGSVSTYSRTQVDPNYTFSGVIDEVIVRPLWVHAIFADDFESGDTTAWSATVP